MFEEKRKSERRHVSYISALMRASAIGNVTSVRLLLTEGGNVNARGPKGSTALMFAVSAGHREIVELLLLHGADIEAKEEEGWTALTLAETDGHSDIVKLLKQATHATHARL